MYRGHNASEVDVIIYTVVHFVILSLWFSINSNLELPGEKMSDFVSSWLAKWECTLTKVCAGSRFRLACATKHHCCALEPHVIHFPGFIMVVWFYNLTVYQVFNLIFVALHTIKVFIFMLFNLILSTIILDDKSANHLPQSFIILWWHPVPGIFWQSIFLWINFSKAKLFINMQNTKGKNPSNLERKLFVFTPTKKTFWQFAKILDFLSCESFYISVMHQSVFYFPFWIVILHCMCCS